MAYTPRVITDRIAQGDDIFRTENLPGGRIRLIPDPDSVTVPGTDVNRALMQPWEEGLANMAQIKETLYWCNGTDDTAALQAIINDLFAFDAPKQNMSLRIIGRLGISPTPVEYCLAIPRNRSGNRLALDFSGCTVPELTMSERCFLQLEQMQQYLVVSSLRVVSHGICLNEVSYSGGNGNNAFVDCDFYSKGTSAYRQSGMTKECAFIRCNFRTDNGGVEGAVFLDRGALMHFGDCSFNASAGNTEYAINMRQNSLLQFVGCDFVGGDIESVHLQEAGLTLNNVLFSGCKLTSAGIGWGTTTMDSIIFDNCDAKWLKLGSGHNVIIRNCLLSGEADHATVYVSSNVQNVHLDGNIINSTGTSLYSGLVAEAVTSTSGTEGYLRVTNNVFTGNTGSIHQHGTQQTRWYIMGNRIAGTIALPMGIIQQATTQYVYMPQYANHFSS